MMATLPPPPILLSGAVAATAWAVPVVTTMPTTWAMPPAMAVPVLTTMPPATAVPVVTAKPASEASDMAQAAASAPSLPPPSSGSFEKLVEYYAARTEVLSQRIVQYGDRMSDPDVNQLLTAIHTEVTQINSNLAKIRIALAERNEKSEILNYANPQLLKQPPESQVKQEPQSAEIPSSASATANVSANIASGKLSTPVYHSGKGKAVESPCGESDEEPGETPAPSHSEIRRKAPGLFIPTMEHLTTEECETVPKYMKGRLTHDQLNSAIDELNKAVYAKYMLINTAKAKQTDAIRTTIRAYKEQECKDTKGLYFIIEADIVNNSRLRLDKSGRSILTILRHCGRLREVRGGGLVRYVVFG